MAYGKAWGKVPYEIEAHEIEEMWNADVKVVEQPQGHWEVQMPFQENAPVIFTEIETTGRGHA